MPIISSTIEKASPTFTQNQYGANVGGPIKRDLTFFFTSWKNFSANSSPPKFFYLVATTAAAKPIRPKAGIHFSIRPLTVPSARRYDERAIARRPPAREVAASGRSGARRAHGCGAAREMKEPGRLVWWPFAVALQGEAANHREVRRSRAGVLSVAEKACCQRVRCGSRRRAKAIPPLKCRKRIGDIQNRGRVVAPGRVWREPADWPGGCPA